MRRLRITLFLICLCISVMAQTKMMFPVDRMEVNKVVAGEILSTKDVSDNLNEHYNVTIDTNLDEMIVIGQTTRMMSLLASEEDADGNVLFYFDEAGYQGVAVMDETNNRFVIMTAQDKAETVHIVEEFTLNFTNIKYF